MTAPIPRDMPDIPAIPGIPVLMPSAVPAAAVMSPVRRPWAALYRLLIAGACAAAVAVEVAIGPPAHVLSHFVVQSNILLALVMLLASRRAWAARRPLPAALTGAALLYVLIGALVHHVLLTRMSPTFSLTGEPGTHTVWQAAARTVLLTAAPVAALLDWLLLTTPDRLHLRQAAPWLLYPLVYLTFILTRGELLLPGTPDRYLYPFLDVVQRGYKHVLGNALLLGLSFYALAVLLVAVDHTRPNPVRRRYRTGFRLRPPVG
ncbi:Pr6Pr family membrane protein [Streptomyces tropicalis]|uniref:Pr6Pr family membrane protein n=1 Tax=Streptomyces tropicalis TaxID=3034234 RepID=A0ABT6A7S7_9ACTN|nr:Pr6Pr family membrane protein [Streptomyces tropicalis]MDF3300702.1 Pr6Pr family membrane protein [Streptomyces tropicalis]